MVGKRHLERNFLVLLGNMAPWHGEAGQSKLLGLGRYERELYGAQARNITAM